MDRAKVIGVALVIAATGCRSEKRASANASVALDRAGVPGIGFAAMTREREIAGGVGVADVARRSNVTAETVFEAASIAKLLVAICVMQLVEEGKVDLDADASKYWVSRSGTRARRRPSRFVCSSRTARPSAIVRTRSRCLATATRCRHSSSAT